MKENSRKKRRMHVAMRATTDSAAATHGRIVRLAVALVVAGAAMWGAYVGAVRLHGIWTEQCVVRDVRSQVRIKATPHVTEEHVRELFRLTNGCNLAKMDFTEMRSRILRKHPIIRDIVVTRHLPDGLEISLAERKPVVRIVSGDERRKARGYLAWNVADAEGMVFEFPKKDTGNLPMVVVPGPPPSRGDRIGGRAMTALRTVLLCEKAGIPPQEFAEVSTENATYLKVTTSDYGMLNILWRILDDPDDPAQPRLEKILANYRKVTRTQLTPPRSGFWATDLKSITMQEPRL